MSSLQPGGAPARPLGKEYAINQLVLFLAITSLACDWERTRTDKSGELEPLTLALCNTALAGHVLAALPVWTKRTQAAFSPCMPTPLPLPALTPCLPQT